MFRTKVNAPTVAKRFCEGLDKKSKGEPCRYYEFPTNRCVALAKDLKKDMFQYGRCLEILLSLIDKKLNLVIRANPSHYAIKGRDKDFDHRIEHKDSEDIRYDIVLQHLCASERKFTALSEWHRYMGKAAKNAVLQSLYRRGLDVRERICKYCKHRSAISPFICSLVRFWDHQTGEIVENPHSGCTTAPSDPACDGFERNVLHLDREADAAEEFEAQRKEETTPESALRTEEIFQKCSDLLLKRVERASSHSVRKKRQWEYLLFQNVAELIRGGFTEAEATTELLKEIHDHKRRQALKKQLNRSRTEINQYLRENLPSDLISDLIGRHREAKGGH